MIKSALTKEDVNLILKLHNNLRSRVRLGFEKRGVSGPQPAAERLKDFPLLVGICYTLR